MESDVPEAVAGEPEGSVAGGAPLLFWRDGFLAIPFVAVGIGEGGELVGLDSSVEDQVAMRTIPTRHFAITL